MSRGLKIGLTLAFGLALAAGTAVAAEPDHGHMGGPPAGGHPGGGPAPGGHPGPATHGPTRGEPHPGPTGYQRLTEPQGWNARPGVVDRGAYQHNFQASRTFKIGPYHRPAGWRDHHWGYGEFLPRAYWAAQYVLADYWLFALEVPPAGYEWVRDGSDALLVNVDTGEILQVEYGVFG